MKIHKPVLIINGAIFVIGFLLMLQGGMSGAGFGLTALCMAFVDLLLVLIYSVAGNRNAMLNALIFAGVFFLIGFSVCSNSPMDFR
jgi:hypothetical protein